MDWETYAIDGTEQKGARGGEEGWGGSIEDSVAFHFSLGPAKTAVVLVITEEVCCTMERGFMISGTYDSRSRKAGRCVGTTAVSGSRAES